MSDPKDTDKHKSNNRWEDIRTGKLNNPTGEGHQASAYEEYLYGRSIISPYQVRNNWSSTTRGRMAIRIISRGIFGAAAFAFANRYATNQLRNYEPDTFKWGEVPFTHKPLQYVAKGFDTVIGSGIERFVRWTAPVGQKEAWAENAVRFRPKTYFHSEPGGPVGRSLGAEIVGVTFDFSSMSLGDAVARNVIQSFDPNMPQPWIIDENGHAARPGKGHFDAQKWGRAVLRSTWRSVTKNAGEDWFAALPYVYQMKWQREALAKIPKFGAGFKTSWDRNRNGGTLLMNQEGKLIGDYQLSGIIDLQGRFVGYNVYTLMYRELYDWASRKIYHTYKHGIHPSEWRMPKHPVNAVVDAFGSSGRYLLKSAIKANLFMQPSVPFFWLFRVPQSKWKSELMLDGAAPEQNYIGTWKPQEAGIPDPHRPNVYRFPYPLKYEDWVRPTRGLTGAPRPDHLYFGHQKVPFPEGLKDPRGLYRFENCPTWTAKILNIPGWISYKTGDLLASGAAKIAPEGSMLGEIISGVHLPANAEAATRTKFALERTVLMRNFGDAAWAYTPYFIAKDEFGLRVNDTPATGEKGKMDKAIYGLIDDVFTFRFKKAGKSFKDIWKLSTEDLQKQNVVHYEGKKVSAEDVEQPSHALPVPITQAPTASPAPTSLRPVTKVQATSVQYNVQPPTHLQHQTPAQAEAQQKVREQAAPWVDALQERQQQTHDSQLPPTVH